jgi:hypothetical protein
MIASPEKAASAMISHFLIDYLLSYCHVPEYRQQWICGRNVQAAITRGQLGVTGLRHVSGAQIVATDISPTFARRQ